MSPELEFYIKDLIRKSLSKLNKDSRVEFVYNIIMQVNPDISASSLEDIISDVNDYVY
jgi:transcriptional regulator CtsR